MSAVMSRLKVYLCAIVAGGAAVLAALGVNGEAFVPVGLGVFSVALVVSERERSRQRRRMR